MVYYVLSDYMIKIYNIFKNCLICRKCNIEYFKLGGMKDNEEIKKEIEKS